MFVRTAVLTAAFVLYLGLAAAQANQLVLCLPGFPGSSTQAQPYVDQILRYLEKKLDRTPNSMTGRYISDGKTGIQQLTQSPPEIALVGPSIYAGQHKKLKMRVIAKLEVNGRGEEVYAVVTRKSGPSRLDELKGKTLVGALFHDEKYVYNVLLDGKLPSGSIQFSHQRRPIKALRDVVSGKADAALIDAEVTQHLKELDFAADLQIIHTAAPVPLPAVVVSGDTANRRQIKQALVGMCQTTDGAEMCRRLTISSIRAATGDDYKPLIKRYNR